MGRPALDQTTQTQVADHTTTVDTVQNQATSQAGVQGAGGAAIDRIAGQGGPEIEATREAMGLRVVQNMANANSTPGGWPGVLTSGVNYSYNFALALQRGTNLVKLDPKKPDLAVVAANVDDVSAYQNADGSANVSAIADLIQQYKSALAASPIKQWDRDYEMGFAAPALLDRVGFMQWKLKPGKRASEALKAWLKGPTVGECYSMMVINLFDTYRAAIGDDAFDARFGDEGSGKSPFYLGQDAPIMDYVDFDRSNPTDGKPGKRPVTLGDWCYFTNHPKYLLKHPGGAWQGENAIYLGEVNGQQTFGGLGATDKTEDSMLDEMVEAYNGPRDEGDKNALDDMKANGGVVPDLYDATKGSFPDLITKKDILDAPAFTIDGETRKGGFSVGSIKRLNAQKVAADRPAAPKARGGR